MATRGDLADRQRRRLHRIKLKATLRRAVDAASNLGGRPNVFLMRRVVTTIFPVVVIAAVVTGVGLSALPGVNAPAQSALSLGLAAVWFGIVKTATDVAVHEGRTRAAARRQLLLYLTRATCRDDFTAAELAEVRVLLWHDTGVRNGPQAAAVASRLACRTFDDDSFNELVERLDGRGYMY